MSERKSLRRALSGALEIFLLVLLALSVVLRFSEQQASPGRVPMRPIPLSLTVCPGDANLDGRRDIRDLVLIQAHILGKYTLSPQALDNADANLDSGLDVRDIVVLLQHSLAQATLASCEPIVPVDAPSIRFIAPTSGLSGSNFSLIGKGFSPNIAENTVIFFRPEATVQAQLTSASEVAITGTVPGTLANNLYAVAVVRDAAGSNFVGFEVQSTPAPLQLLPSSATLLMPPGSGKELFVIGGGTPPYRLLPLSEWDADSATAELTGSVIEVTGLQTGSAQLQIEDSADPPATDSATVSIQEPRFEPTFDILFHTLLAGSSPSFTITMNQFSSDMRIQNTEIFIEEGETVSSDLQEGDTLGFGKDIYSGFPDHQLWQVKGTNGEGGLSFEVLRHSDDAVFSAAEGTLGGGSARMTLRQVPDPPPEGVVRAGLTSEIILNDQLIRLPVQAGEDFDVVATFTSTVLIEGEEQRLTKTVTRTFTTVAPPSGAPQIQRLLSVHGEVSRRVEIVGSGFDPSPENNIVTFSGPDNTRVEAPVDSVLPDRLVVFVPLGAVSGTVRVSVDGLNSNDYRFWVLFQPRAGLFFSAGETQPVGTAEILALGLTVPAASEALAPVLQLAQDQEETAFTVMRVALDQGAFTTAGLEIGDGAGEASLITESSGGETVFQVSYGGQEETQEGPGRHLFLLKKDPESTPVATIFVGAREDDTGVVFELVPENLSVPGRFLTVVFDKQIYLPPGDSVDPINMTVEVRSGRWNFFELSSLATFYGQELTLK